MVKHTQTIRPLLPTNCFNVFDHFVRLEGKWLNPYVTFYWTPGTKDFNNEMFSDS